MSAIGSYVNLNGIKSVVSSAVYNPLFDKASWAFKVYVVAGASVCAYHLYQAYQFSCHTSFGLSDNLKLVKCQALIDEAQEKEDNQP